MRSQVSEGPAGGNIRRLLALGEELLTRATLQLERHLGTLLIQQPLCARYSFNGSDHLNVSGRQLLRMTRNRWIKYFD